MILLRRTTVCGLALLVIGIRPVVAQTAPNGAFAAVTTDSAAWQQVLMYVVERLSPQIVRAANDPNAQPWRIEISSREPQRQLLETQLRSILRARDATPEDSVTRTLKIGPLSISNDTARVDVGFDETHKCPGSARTTGFGWSTSVVVPREPQFKFWGAARSKSTTLGDRVSCPRV
ncbi:MAG: hypothetical protein ACREMS_01185 [Gemmatimonadaceae bacterium]